MALFGFSDTPSQSITLGYCADITTQYPSLWAYPNRN